uniref:Nudix hydrolase domain-containing protein n=1 Tax=Quercus lobata TaxID=97700 RepID=A0A7N2LHX6_QUELO
MVFEGKSLNISGDQTGRVKHRSDVHACEFKFVFNFCESNRDESKEVSSKQKKVKRKVTAEATATTAETEDKKKKQFSQFRFYNFVKFANPFRFLLKFTGKDKEINLLGDGTEKAEFGEWSWISPEQIVELVGTAVDFNKPVYKEVMTVFAPYL